MSFLLVSRSSLSQPDSFFDIFWNICLRDYKWQTKQNCPHMVHSLPQIRRESPYGSSPSRSHLFWCSDNPSAREWWLGTKPGSQLHCFTQEVASKSFRIKALPVPSFVVQPFDRKIHGVAQNHPKNHLIKQTIRARLFFSTQTVSILAQSEPIFTLTDHLECDCCAFYHGKHVAVLLLQLWTMSGVVFSSVWVAKTIALDFKWERVKTTA